MFRTILAAVTGVVLTVGIAAADSLKFGVTDITGLESLQTEYGEFAAALTEVTGSEVEFFPVNSRTAAVEAMAGGTVDFILTGPAEYIVFRARAGAVPVVAWQRLDYFTQVVTTTDSGIITIDDLKGKKIAFGDVGSTSTHLGPAQLLASRGLMPGKDYEVLNIHRNVAVEALLQGNIDAFTVGSSHLVNIRDKFPGAGLRVAGRGPDLPNDVLVAGKHVPTETVELVRSAFVNNAQKLMDAALLGEENKKYIGGSFIPNVEDKDYEYIRQGYITVGAENLAKFIDE